MKPIDAVAASIGDLLTIHDRCLVVTGRIINCDWPWDKSQDNDVIALLRQRLNDAVWACHVVLDMVGAQPAVTLMGTDE